MIFVFFLAFNKPEVIERAIKRFKWNTDLSDLNFKAIIADPGYPLPSEEENKLKLIEIAARQGCEYYQIENQGQDKNINQLNKRFLKPSDISVFYDPDNNFDKATWLKDSVTILQEGVADFVTVGCVHFLEGHHVNVYQNQGQLSEHKGIWFKDLTWPGGWPVGIYSGRTFSKHEIKASHNYYGGTEGNILLLLQGQKVRGVMLRDHLDTPETVEFDPEYIAWKAFVIDKPKQPSFKEWLCQKSQL